MTATMFTEGLDPSALRWVREAPMSNSSPQPPLVAPTPPMAHVGAGRGFVMPRRPVKFGSGQFPSRAVPVSSRAMAVDDDPLSGSDMEESSGSDAEIYGASYSFESSRRGNAPQQRVPNGRYTSDSYSDLSSSRGASWQQVTQRQHVKRNYVRASDYTEEEEGEASGGSSEFTSGIRRSDGNGGAMRGRPAESYSSNVDTDADKSYLRSEFHDNKLHGHRVPSAPPFHGCESVSVVDEVSSVPASGASYSEDLCASRFKEAPSRDTDQNKSCNEHVGTTSFGVDVPTSSGSALARVPTFHASCNGPWYYVIAYDACVRLCLNSWARGCMEAPVFLENECSLLRNSFGLQQILLQSEEELLARQSSEVAGEKAAPKCKKTFSKMKVQVRRVRMGPDMPSGCGFSTLKSSKKKWQSVRYHMSNLQSTMSSGWKSFRKVRMSPNLPAHTSFSRHSLAYMRAGAQYIKQVSGLLKFGVTSLRSQPSYEIVQEMYSCSVKLRSSTEEAGVRMQPGSGETHLFFPESLGDELIIEVYDSKGKSYGRVLAQVASISEIANDKRHWWPIFREPEHELVGRIQLQISYIVNTDENNLKCGSVAETVAYDLVLEVAMKVQHFQQRSLQLQGSWKWLLTEFASYYGISDSYTKLRYLTYVMDVATPTADCLSLVHDLLLPVIMRSHSKNLLSHQENRILGEIEDQIEQILSKVFENYKSLDESSHTGIVEVFRPASGMPAPVLVPAVKLYSLLHDVLSPEAQLKICSYFQAAAKKRSRRLLSETDEYIASGMEDNLMDPVSLSTAYQKMKTLCLNIRNEIFTDIEIHNHEVFPSFVDLPNIGASIYSAELCSRLRSFLVACPPSGPSPPVVDLVIATADFQRDLASWNISPVKGGVDAKELFHLYIIRWIQDKRLSILEYCKVDKVKWSGVRTPHLTTPFVDEMYDRLKEMLNEYEVIISRWPEYTFVLEHAIADIEKAVVEALDKQYADILAPLKDSMTPKKFGLKYVQKLAKRNTISPYVVPDELGILLNTMKRLLDVLRPKIEMQLKSWSSCIPDDGNSASGERLSEVTVLLRAKFRNYLQAVVEKLAENTRAQNATKLKKIIQDSKDAVMEADIRTRMQPLTNQLIETINHLHSLVEIHVFVVLCRGFWDRMGQDALKFLENRKEIRSWYKASRVTVTVLDDAFASQMQQLLGNSLQEKDLEPPRSIMEVRSVLCKDAPKHNDSTFYY